MMFIRSLADFNGTPWAVQVTVGAITVTEKATSSPDRHDAQGSGDFYLATNGDIYLAISGDLQLATNGDFHLATDTPRLFYGFRCSPGDAMTKSSCSRCAISRIKPAS